ncbi:MAG: segregation and condensation protein A [Opitutales bacterium]
MTETSEQLQDRLLTREIHSVRLPVFEGPLDLLLFLIRRNEIDIYDIPIEEVTKQYLSTLRSMEQLNLEVAGEFFVMAAQLMYIKSRLLLPRHQQGPDEVADEVEDGADPRWQLVQQLLEYRGFKEAAEALRERIAAHNEQVARFVGTPEELPERPLKPVDRIALWNTFNLVLRRLAEKLVEGEIHEEPVTVADQMEVILGRIESEPRFLFTSLCGQRPSVPLLVASFLAILELSRLGRLHLRQHEAFADIEIHALAQATPEPVPAV